MSRSKDAPCMQRTSLQRSGSELIPLSDLGVLIHFVHPGFYDRKGIHQTCREGAHALGLEKSADWEPLEVSDRHLVCKANIATCLLESSSERLHVLRELDSGQMIGQGTHDLVLLLPVCWQTELELFAIFHQEERQNFPPQIVGQVEHLLHLCQAFRVDRIESARLVESPGDVPKHRTTFGECLCFAIILCDLQNRNLAERSSFLKIGPFFPGNTKVLERRLGDREGEPNLLGNALEGKIRELQRGHFGLNNGGGGGGGG
mmetsp:Transcript_26284/g.39964  ORF Transcript_26284/g.39964 Transcript_26284/m.39964 type:complete len:260 (+) Transcript_26284:333-1112(+)